MVSREFIHSVIKSNRIIAVHMKDNQRLDGLSKTIYLIYDLLLNEEDEEMLILNRKNGINTDGF